MARDTRHVRFNVGRLEGANLEEDDSPQSCSSTQLDYWTHGLVALL
jgi:hypothetical protein